MIDQTLLPNELVTVEYDDFNQVANATKTLVVREASAIGVSGAFGMVLSSFTKQSHYQKWITFWFRSGKKILFATRPTAVNLNWGLEKIMKVAKTGDTIEQIKNLVILTAKKW